MNDEAHKQLLKLEEDMAAAIVANDAQGIGRFLADDWIIIGPEGRVIERAAFLGAVTSGDLTHESMESDDWRVRVYEESAVVTTEATTQGQYKGEVFSTHERSTSVYVKQVGRWQCVLTHLTPIKER